MTEHEKESVSRMRRRGFGCTDIARALNIPEKTIKSYCTRNSLQDADLQATYEAWREFSIPLECKQCGKPLSQGMKQKPKSFCSDSCRLAWWNSHRSEVRQKSASALKCAVCGKEFSSYESNRKFCSISCYMDSRFGGSRHDARSFEA